MTEQTLSASATHARSWLFAPGDSERKMEKAAGGAADIVLLDLEDSVAPSEKAKARSAVSAFLKAQPSASAQAAVSAHGFMGANASQRERLWVRINPINGPDGLADLAAVVPAAPGGILLPKVRGRPDAEVLHHHLTELETATGLAVGSTRVMLLLAETPESFFAMGSFTGVARLASMSWGAEDLATALGATGSRRADGSFEFTYELARSFCLIAASAAGVSAIETIHADFRNDAGLRRQSGDARRAGFSGMLAIHPDQVDVINEVFTPTAEELAAARSIIDLFAANPGASVVANNGVMLDRPHLTRARALLARAGARR